MKPSRYPPSTCKNLSSPLGPPSPAAPEAILRPDSHYEKSSTAPPAPSFFPECPAKHMPVDQKTSGTCRQYSTSTSYPIDGSCSKSSSTSVSNHGPVTSGGQYYARSSVCSSFNGKYGLDAIQESIDQQEDRSSMNMYAAALPYDALHAKHVASAGHPGPYMGTGGNGGESSYSSPVTNSNSNYSSPTKLGSPVSAGSNLQTLRKFSNLQSLQNLNLTNISNDSPRASYSSSSSSTTSSSSSNLIIPEIFKQDTTSHLPSYPLPPQLLPPKSRDSQSPPHLNNSQLSTSNFLHHPQPLQLQSKYSQPSHYPGSNKTPLSADSSPLQRPHNTNSDLQQKQLMPKSQPNGPICSALPPSSFHSYAPTYGYASPPTTTFTNQNTNNNLPLQSSVQPSSGFTSYPNSSSFTSYSSSHHPAIATPIYSGNPKPSTNNRLTSCQPETSSSINGNFSGTNKPLSAQHPPDSRRLSDPNSRRVNDVLPPQTQQRIPNEYPQLNAHRATNVYERPGDQRPSGGDAVAALSKTHQALAQQHMEHKQDPQQRPDKDEKNQEQPQKQHKQQLHSLKEPQKQSQQSNKSESILKHQPGLQNSHVTTSINSPSKSCNNITSSNNKICSNSNNPVKSNNSTSASSGNTNKAILSSTGKANICNLNKNIGNSPVREQLTAQQQQQQQKHQQQSSEQLLSLSKPPTKQQQSPQQQISQQQQQQPQQHKVLRGDTLVEKNSPCNVGKGAHLPRDSSQNRGHSRESRGVSRDRLGNAYPRHDYFQQKIHEYPSKSQDYLNQLQDYPNDHQEYSPSKKLDYPIVCQDNNRSKSQEYLNKLEYPTSPSKSPQEYHGKVPDYPIKTQAYKSPQGRGTAEVLGIDSGRQHFPQTMSGVPQGSGSLATSNALRERVGSPHRVTSPPVKLHEGPRLQSPPVKMIDPRHEYNKLEAMNNPGTCSKLESGVPTTPLSLNSAHFLQSYPERDNSKSQAPVWEAGYLLEKYSGGPYSPLPPVYPAAKLEKAIDDQDYQDTRPSNGILSSKENDVTYQAEKEDADSACSTSGVNVSGSGGNATDLQKVAASKVPTKLVPLTALPSESLEMGYHQGGGITQHDHVGLQQCQGHHVNSLSPETTDCGSLSKSSSDGDHSLINRKRPPTKLKSKRRNILSFPHHLSMDELRLIQRREESYGGGGGGSSSDDNRSSGRASMSDGHTSSSPPVDTLPRPHDHHAKSQLKAVPEDERLSAAVTAGGAGGGARPVGGGVRRPHQPQKGGRYRLGATGAFMPKDDLSLQCASGGLTDIKQAIERLTLRSQGSHTSYSTSTYSSMSGSEGEPNRRLVRHSSLETVNTNVTAADEFVWVDSHNRLVELQQLPWSNHDVLKVIQQGRVREQLDRVSIEAVPRLSYLLQRALVRVAREAQRLTRPLAMCSKQEISSAFKIVLSPALADSCIKSCLRAAAMYTVSGDHLRQAKAARAGLNLSVGRFMRWMCDVRVGKFIHEYAAVYLTAGLENLLEELVLQCLPREEQQMLTAALLEHAIANNADLWGLLQPYAHLNAGRTATGALCLPRWASTGSIERTSSVTSAGAADITAAAAAGNNSACGGGGGSDSGNSSADNSSGGGSCDSSSAAAAAAAVVAAAAANASCSSVAASGSVITLGSCSSGNGACGSTNNGSNANSTTNHNSRCSSSMTLTPDEHATNNKTLEQSLLTTCVGSLAELSDLLSRVAIHHQQTARGATPGLSSSISGSISSTSGSLGGGHNNNGSSSRLLSGGGSGNNGGGASQGSSCNVTQLGPLPPPPTTRPGSSIGGNNKALVTWGPSALHALFYFMRCSQLEQAELSFRAPIQELVYERPYIVLPPLVEWVRVATAHTEHRHSTVVDKDDVMQAARLLLPAVDCPVRTIGYEELMCPRRELDELECAQKFKVDLAFKMLSCGRTELVPHALQLLPSTKVNTVNEYGLTPLMLACIRGDEALVKQLLNANADVDAETPPTGPAYLMANPETQHWTALTYAAIHGHYSLAQTLLSRGGSVEGGATLSEEKCTETPLQVAVAAGHTELVGLLLSCGANPYLSTLMKGSLCYSGAAQRGCYAAIAVAAAHGQRNILHKLLAHPTHQNTSAREVLSLEEILAEGASNHTNDREQRGRQINNGGAAASGIGSATSLGAEDPRLGGKGSINSSSSEISQGLKLTKQQVKTLQEAMYHSAESGHLEMTLDLRNLGVPWTLHCWMHTLATAHEHRLETIIDQLLQDFLQVWPDDYSAQFVDEGLPLLFTIFRNSKNEGTSLLLADIFSSCYGKEPIKEVRDTSVSGGARIDIGFVNNPELSDVQFRVEGRVFYAHKIILVNASSRFKQMLSSKFSEGNPPIVQIHDIRYDIFDLVMQSLYKGGCKNLSVEPGDVLELMGAANFFQLDSLQRYCEARCSTLVHLHNVVTMYLHAKVYGAQLLLEYCQGFLLQNMVALLTYDDSVRRLIFGKRLHNHDVLAGLLSTLQSRIKARASPRAGKN